MTVLNAINRLIHILKELNYTNVLNNTSTDDEQIFSDLSDSDESLSPSENTEDGTNTVSVDKENIHSTMQHILKYILMTHENYDMYGNTFEELLDHIKIQLLEYIENRYGEDDFDDDEDEVHLIKSPISTKIDKYLSKYFYRAECKNIYVSRDVGYEVNIVDEHEITLKVCYTYWYRNELVIKYNVLTNKFYMVSYKYGSMNGRGSYYNSSNINIEIEGGIDEVKNMYDVVLRDEHLDKKYII